MIGTIGSDGGEGSMSGSGPLGKALRGFRQRAGLTQQEAADLAGLSVAGLRDVEQGRVLAPRAQTLRRLGVALGLSGTEVDELVQLGHAGRSRREQTDRLWIGVLGPLVVQVDGADVDLGSETQRVLLARLALSPNVTLSRDLLIEVAWGSQPPSAADVLPTRVSRLRRRLQPQAPEAGAPVLVATGGGYQLTATEDQLDLLAFRGLVRQARRRRTNGELPGACDLFADAVGRWRGEPLAGLAALADHPAVVSITREWQSVVVEYATIAIDLGRHAEVTPLLRRVVEADPLHERAHARLMMALAGSGQQASALTVFDALRRRLADELGADPGPELAEAHLRVLRQEVTRPEVVPVNAHRQLPPDIADFRGREAELRRLYERVPLAGATAVPIAAIEGMGGVGKTRLAIHLAHQLLAAGHYADQQLYVDLHGHADEPPADPAAVLASFLHLLGVAGDQIPVDLSGRSALYRDRLHGKRALVLLDNAASEEQITPLLPAGPTNLVLVTSRRTLALDGAHALPLDVFTTQEAMDFLTHVIGPDRVNADPAAAERVIDLCGRLPLAVALVARRLQARSAWTLADLAARLAERRNRLSELAAGTRRLRAVFELSYQALPAHAQRLYRMLGLHPGDDFTADSVAALTGSDPVSTAQALDRLVDEHLVTVSSGNRYRLHDLLRDYAYELAQQDGWPARREAVGRVLDWYVSAADAAQQLLFPGRRVLPPDRPQPAHPPTFTDDDHAFRWLEAEHANLVTAVTTARDYQLWQAGWQLPATLRHYFERISNWDDWLATAEAGLAAARQGEDRQGEALALNDLGTAYGHLGQLDRCVGLLTRAAELSHAIGDREHEAYALNNLGVALTMRGELDEAVGYLQRALEIVDALGVPHFQARALSNLGRTQARLGQYGEAIRCLRSVLALQSRLEDPVGFAQSLRNLGEALLRDGRPAEAARVLRDAVTLHRRKHARADEAETLATLSETLYALGKEGEGKQHLQRAVAILQELRHPAADELRARLAQVAVPVAQRAP